LQHIEGRKPALQSEDHNVGVAQDGGVKARKALRGGGVKAWVNSTQGTLKVLKVDGGGGGGGGGGEFKRVGISRRGRSNGDRHLELKKGIWHVCGVCVCMCAWCDTACETG